ncbi:MAG: TetR family transcriptional regulator [Acidobacteriota bacterium]
MSELSPPQQERSRKSLTAISEATKRLLRTHTFAEITIAQINNEAETSIGSFYARFKGKVALLHHLHEELAEASKRDVDYFVSLKRDELLTPEEFADLWMPEAVKSHLEHRGILRAVMLEAFDDPQFGARATDLIRHVSKALANLIVNTSRTRAEHVGHVQQSVGAVMTILDREVLFLREGKSRKLSAEKVDWLKRIFVASMTPASQSKASKRQSA